MEIHKQIWQKTNVIAVVVAVNLLGSEKDWVVDTGATKHICGDRAQFSSYEPVKDEEFVYRSNSRTSPFIGEGKVLLNLTFAKVLLFLMVCMCLRLSVILCL